DTNRRSALHQVAPSGLPMRPTPFYVQAILAMPGGEEVISGLPVEHRYEGNIFSGEKRTELLVVPALSVRVTPQVAIVPAAAIRSAPAPTPTLARATPAANGRRRGGAARPAAPARQPAPARQSAPPARETSG